MTTFNYLINDFYESFDISLDFFFVCCIFSCFLIIEIDFNIFFADWRSWIRQKTKLGYSHNFIGHIETYNFYLLRSSFFLNVIKFRIAKITYQKTLNQHHRRKQHNIHYRNAFSSKSHILYAINE